MVLHEFFPSREIIIKLHGSSTSSSHIFHIGLLCGYNEQLQKNTTESTSKSSKLFKTCVDSIYLSFWFWRVKLVSNRFWPVSNRWRVPGRFQIQMDMSNFCKIGVKNDTTLKVAMTFLFSLEPTQFGTKTFDLFNKNSLAYHPTILGKLLRENGAWLNVESQT